MRTVLIFVVFITIPGIQACNNMSFYEDSERELDTDKYYDVLDHVAVYYPRGVALNFPGYIVGVEEAPRRMVATDISSVNFDESVYEAGYTVRRLAKALRYRSQFVSQIMRYEGKPYGEGNCYLYNLYHNHDSGFVNPCASVPEQVVKAKYDSRYAFKNSWRALDVLKAQLKEDIARNQYSHIIVAVMGLDTAQEEAIRNYKSIISSSRLNAGAKFKPLFIGVTWPSFYANRWFDPIWEVLSYHPVADRADILGLTWLGVLLNDVVLPLSDRIEVSVIAHSFGARASSMGLCVGPAILPDNGVSIRKNRRGKIENFIGLAPAFSQSRFINEDYRFYENVYYKDYCPMINRFVFTASKSDEAFSPVFWSDAVGSHKYMKRYCASKQPVDVSCITVDRLGDIPDYRPEAKLTYIDTSILMKYTMPGTQGGGHSDVYRPEIGRLIWTILDEDNHK